MNDPFQQLSLKMISNVRLSVLSRLYRRPGMVTIILSRS